MSKNIYCDTYEWLPVVEPELGQERFLPEDPTTLLRNGSFAKVPVIIGVTENEFGKRAARLFLIWFLLFFNFAILSLNFRNS